VITQVSYFPVSLSFRFWNQVKYNAKQQSEGPPGKYCHVMHVNSYKRGNNAKFWGYVR
jgi:hypothetical protein